jgi:hypothetical protein
MTIDEQHVGVEFGFQKVASSQYDSLLPEEIDLALNVAQLRFIKSRLANQRSQAPGFVNSQRHFDDIRELVVKNKKLPTTLVVVSDANYEPNLVAAVLPYDYLFLVADRSEVVSDGRAAPKRTTVDINSYEHVTVLEQAAYTTLTVQYTYNVGGQSVTALLFDIDTTSLKGGLVSPERFELIRLLLEKLNSNPYGLTFYWEVYGDLLKPSSLIAISERTSGVVTITTELGSKTSTLTTRKLKRYTDLSGKLVVNRLTNPEELHLLQRNPFARSSRRSPISTLSRSKLYTYEDDYLVVNTLIDYLRYPQRLSKSDGLSCELSPHTHQEIVDLAVEYLQLSTSNPDYQAKLTDDTFHSDK